VSITRSQNEGTFSSRATSSSTDKDGQVSLKGEGHPSPGAVLAARGFEEGKQAQWPHALLHAEQVTACNVRLC
jgi:hypothetical protein